MTYSQTMQRHGRLALLLLTSGMLWTDAMAQGASTNTQAATAKAGKAAVPATPTTAAVAPVCVTRAAELPVAALYGRWELTFDGGVDRASVLLQKHPDYDGGVRGTLTRAGRSAELAGDIDDEGLLTLDESQDGHAISATWSGDLQAGSCGREFTGTRRDARDDSTRSFVLRKTPN